MADRRRVPYPYQRSASSGLGSADDISLPDQSCRQLSPPSPDRADARPRIRVGRAFSQIEEPATLQQLNELLVPTARKTLDVRRLVSPARLRAHNDASGLRTPPPVPPTSPASLPRATPHASPVPRAALRKQISDAADGQQPAAWGRPGLPPRNISMGRADEVASDRRRSSSVTARADKAAVGRRQDASEWLETAARLNLRVQELERENLRLKSGAPLPKSFAGGEIRALQSTAAAGRGLLKSQSCANGFGVTGLTVAEAAAASRRARSKRLAAAAGPSDAATKLRAGYWNGANNVKSSFSCNNLADLEQPEFLLEKLRTVAPSVRVDAKAAVPPAPAAALRRSESFQRTSSETEDAVAAIKSQQKAARTKTTTARHEASSSRRITSPRSYFEAGLRTSSRSFTLGPPPAPTASSRPSSFNVGPPPPSVRPSDIRMWVGTWNMGAADPFEDSRGLLDEQRSAAMLRPFLPHGYQLYVLGVQEGVSENVYHAVEAFLNRNEQGTRYYRLELKNRNFSVGHKNQPPDAVFDAVHGRGDGAFVGTKFTGVAVFHCADLAPPKLQLIRAGVHKFKLTSGSKGGVAVALRVDHTTLVFVNCHLDARSDAHRREQLRSLNASLGRVMGHASFELTEQFHHVVWMGDLNYRISLLDPPLVLHMLESGRTRELHDKFDGLILDRRNGGVFEGFTEPAKFPDFYPTYKKFPKRGYVDETLPLWPALVYRVLYKEPFYKGGKVKKRVPGWCDRILVHSLLVSDSKLLPEKVRDPTAISGSEGQPPQLIDNYRSVNHGDGMDVSDHSPVFATFVLSFPQLDPSEGLRATAASGSPHLTRRNSRSFSMASGGGREGDRFTSTVGGSYFDQARVVRQMKAQHRTVSTVLRIFNMQLSWDDNVVVPKKTRVVAPLVGEDAKQCDVIGERCQAANGMNLSLNAVLQHARPLEQLHMLVWVKNDAISGHCTLSLKRIARQPEGGEVKFRVPLYNDSMRVHLDGHPLLVVFSVRSKTFAK
ncbi:hypothetical protein BBJ28_00015843 [Nothophytophthora sp. Chile5]|nr:hypothetical protein BBJ28_00015843 [Nothophytophthora sp. Chile5]